MFYIHQSNQMELLATQLSNLIKIPLSDNPFAQDKVLVQSPGMSQWLKIFIAEQLGVMANVDFPLPSSFIWTLYQCLLDDLPELSAFNKEDMCWKLLTILPQHLADNDFVPLKNYLSDDDSGLKAFQLCEKIADVFDQYLMYRSDWIDNWQQGIDDIDGSDIRLHPWQAKLWRALVSHTDSLGQSGYHRGNLHDILLAKLPDAFNQNTHQLHQQLPSRLFIFGISALPRQQLYIFEKLALHVDVHLMLFNPCQHYWGDIVDEKHLAKVKARFAGKKQLGHGDYLTVGNPLLASWGKLGRDYLELLVDVEAKSFDYFFAPEGEQLLTHIQRDIYDLTFCGSDVPLEPLALKLGEHKIAIDRSDNSLQLHACHSPLREVEVLHDQLLLMFEQNPSLTPKDVIVMMPDVASYSPYIDAVFAANDDKQLRIPYAISDKGFALENPIVNSFLQLMQLPDSRFYASELLDLLSVPAICAAMGLVEDDIDLVAHWIEQVGIRWGIDGEHKKSLKLPDDELNSWRFGLNRLLMGYAIGEESLVDGILPFKHVEGQQADVLGKLVYFVDHLIDFKQRFSQVCTISDKVAVAHELLAIFYQPNKEEAQALITIKEVLDGVKRHEVERNYLAEVTQRVFSYFVNQGFSDKGVGQRFLAGQVNFCTLMPMRSIPFKVICLLGMNDADYPRFVAPVGFDLMAAGQARKGDRSRRQDDRYLLLEALLSAREIFYISYVGRSMQDNSERMPSVLVSELVEYIEQAFEFEQQSLLTQHPLQPFNPAYFRVDSLEQNSPLVSFSRHWYRYVNQKVKPLETKRLNQDNDQVHEINIAPQSTDIELSELLRFMCHPVRYFFNQTLQLHFGSVQRLEQDDEAFHVDALTRYQLLEHLTFDKLSAENKLDFAHVSGGGALPHRAVGQTAFVELDGKAQDFVNTLQATSMKVLAPVEVNIALDGYAILGWIKQLTTDGLLFYRPARITAKDKLTAWLHHVAMAAIGRPVKTKHIGLDMRIEFNPMSKDEAKAVLFEWLEMYLAGLKQPLPFFLKSSEQWSKTQDMAKVAKVFMPSGFSSIPSEGEDVYIERVYRDVDRLPAAFTQLAERIYHPLMQHIQECE